MANEQDRPDQQRQEEPGPAPALQRPVTRRDFLVGSAVGGAVGVAATAGVVAIADALRGEEVLKPSDEPVKAQVVTLNVNGKDYQVYVTANNTLLEVLRQDLGLTGSKLGCDRSECSACAVLIDGTPVNSCSALAMRESGKKIVTIEGLEKDGVLHPVQAAFVKNMGFQCGFCTPGMIMQTVGFLQVDPNPTDAEIKHALSGNLCKCSAYPNILASVKEAAKAMRSA